MDTYFRNAGDINGPVANNIQRQGFNIQYSHGVILQNLEIQNYIFKILKDAS